MALISPFINSIRAFDATQGTTINLSVLGGDAITKYQFRLYKNDGSISPFYTSEWVDVANDVASQSIRNFPIALNAGFGLVNNNSYKIEPIIANDDYHNGIIGQQTLFQCYAIPSLSLEYKTIIDGVSTFVSADPHTIFNASSVDFRVGVNPTDINSPIKPNSIEVALYGLDYNGNKSIISKPITLYNFTLDTDSGTYYLYFSLGGFSVNINGDGSTLSDQSSLYSSFEVDIVFHSVDGMQVNLVAKELYCYYSTIDNPNIFDVFNICDKGVINLRYALTSLEATSNPSEPIFVDESEVDLTNRDSWALWQKYFTLSQPFTLRIWVRSFNVGSIFVASATNRSSNYINIAYNVEEENGVDYSFISLECGQSTSAGDSMFPYYLESDRIETSLITEDTNAFIGIQKQNGLFNLKFQIL